MSSPKFKAGDQVRVTVGLDGGRSATVVSCYTIRGGDDPRYGARIRFADGAPSNDPLGDAPSGERDYAEGVLERA